MNNVTKFQKRFFFFFWGGVPNPLATNRKCNCVFVCLDVHGCLLHTRRRLTPQESILSGYQKKDRRSGQWFQCPPQPCKTWCVAKLKTNYKNIEHSPVNQCLWTAKWPRRVQPGDTFFWPIRSVAKAQTDPLETLDPPQTGHSSGFHFRPSPGAR